MDWRRDIRNTGEPCDAVAPFERALRRIVGEIIGAFAGMGVDHPEGRLLAQQINKDTRQQRMFEHIGEIAGMETVSIIHPPS